MRVVRPTATALPAAIYTLLLALGVWGLAQPEALQHDVSLVDHLRRVLTTGLVAGISWGLLRKVILSWFRHVNTAPPAALAISTFSTFLLAWMLAVGIVLPLLAAIAAVSGWIALFALSLAAMSAPIASLARWLSTARPPDEVDIQVRSIINRSTVPIPPVWFLRAWTRGPNNAAPLLCLDQLIQTSEAESEPLRAHQLPGLPRGVRLVARFLGSRPAPALDFHADPPVAFHEAGHLAAYCLMPRLPKPILASIAGYHDTEGHVLLEPNYHFSDGSTLRDTIIATRAGYSAEVVHDPSGRDVLTGHLFDVQQIWSMERKHDALYPGVAGNWNDLTECWVREHWTLVEEFAQELLEHGSIPQRFLHHRIRARQQGTKQYSGSD